ncbi:hypothetical protein OL229_16225 [Neisseriaceae bacterium JH1-16]|nr:hypothetical protein [Neisseriaceae bacterium JH1-16]
MQPSNETGFPAFDERHPLLWLIHEAAELRWLCFSEVAQQLQIRRQRLAALFMGRLPLIDLTEPERQTIADWLVLHPLAVMLLAEQLSLDTLQLPGRSWHPVLMRQRLAERLHGGECVDVLALRLALAHYLEGIGLAAMRPRHS